jgi:hypothetical protein
VYGIHNNHDHIDEGERVKGDRGGRKERVEEWREVGERWGEMRETGDKAKRKKGGEGRKWVGERSRGREKEEEEWEKTTPCPPPHRFRDSFCLFWNHKCTAHPCHLKINKVQPPLLFDVANKAKDQDSFCKK